MSFSFQQVRFNYPGELNLALDQVTFEIPARCTTAVLGLSGSGKSTALALASLLQSPRDNVGRPTFSGEIKYHSLRQSRELTYSSLSKPECNDLRRHEFGVVLQRPYMLPHFSCLDNVAMPLALAGVPKFERDAKAKALLEAAGVGGLAHKLASAVSGGERQRMAVLRAIVHDPCVVFADEPVSSLDFKFARVVLELLAAWRLDKLMHSPDRPATDRPATGQQPSRSLVLVTHNLETAKELADYYLVVHYGRVVGGKLHAKSSVSLEQLRVMVERGEDG